MTVRSSLMPRTSCGAPMAFGCSRWTTAGAGSSPPSSIGTPSVSAGMSASAATASPPCSRSPWGLPGCMARPLRRGSGAGLADGSRLPVSVGPLHQPDQVLGHPAVLRLRRRAPDQRRRRAVQSHAEGTDHPWCYRNIAELRDAVRDLVELYNAQWIVEKNGYLSPAQARRGTPRSQSGPPRETNLCPRNRVRYKHETTDGAQTRADEASRLTAAGHGMRYLMSTRHPCPRQHSATWSKPFSEDST